MREIEVKFEVKDIRAIKQKIKKIGAKYKGKHSQLDIWFDTLEKSLGKKRTGLRLRRQEGKTMLTVKGKQVFGKSFREAEESEVRVSDFDKTRKMLAELGFQRELIIKKEREVWERGNLSIVLDRVEDLGTFLELEGSKRDIEKAIKDLGLEKARRIIDHYGQLFFKKASLKVRTPVGNRSNVVENKIQGIEIDCRQNN